MNVRDLIPWSRNGGNQLPTAFREGDRDPFLSLHREVNRLFDDMFRGFGAGLPFPWRGPRIPGRLAERRDLRQ
ncbi:MULTISPECIES: hypothetical protein [Paracoccus]|uniref:hypothetical protein n=1 Tax=Paracoccus TaxID=265 RepID=UPI001FCC7D1A|nr:MULTISPECIES: hypothetical protein [Paracoccus]